MRMKELFILLVVSALGLTACGGSAAPSPGATFSGQIETGSKVGSGTIRFAISDDGASIVDLDLVLNQVRCDGLSMGRVHDFQGGVLASMANGGFSAAISAMGGEVDMYELNTTPSAFPVFASLEDIGRIDGEFSSPTQASGTISIYVWVLFTEHACDLGEFHWSAEAQ